MAAKDSILDSILRVTDNSLNANPLRQVIPVDWAEIAPLAAVPQPTREGGGRHRRFQHEARTGHDGHLERGMAALVRVGTTRTGGFRQTLKHCRGVLKHRHMPQPWLRRLCRRRCTDRNAALAPHWRAGHRMAC